MPFFTVVIPLYNKERFIVNTLKSVLAQTYSDFEVVIVNDGSTDRSEEQALSVSDSRIEYHSKENAGASTARNFGIAAAKSEYITFLDADDYWYPDFLQVMYDRIMQFPKQQVFAGAIEIETSKNVIPAQYSMVKTGEYELVNYFDASLKETVICTSCAVFHKSVFEVVGVFDVDIRSGQDSDLWIRIGLNYKVLFCWKILARYVFDAESLSKKKQYTSTKINFSKFEVIEKERPELNKFLDLNRFSLAIKSKLISDQENFERFSKVISQKNLNFKKRILLQMPGSLLRFLVKTNQFLVNIGLMSSVFR